MRCDDCCRDDAAADRAQRDGEATESAVGVGVEGVAIKQDRRDRGHAEAEASCGDDEQRPRSWPALPDVPGAVHQALSHT
jgi:hypothetical protein